MRLQAPVLLSQQRVHTSAPVPTQARLLLVRLQLFMGRLCLYERHCCLRSGVAYFAFLKCGRKPAG